MEENRDSPQTVEVRGVSLKMLRVYHLGLEVLQEAPVSEQLLLVASQPVVLEQQSLQLSI